MCLTPKARLSRTACRWRCHRTGSSSGQARPAPSEAQTLAAPPPPAAVGLLDARWSCETPAIADSVRWTRCCTSRRHTYPTKSAGVGASVLNRSVGRRRELTSRAADRDGAAVLARSRAKPRSTTPAGASDSCPRGSQRGGAAARAARTWLSSRAVRARAPRAVERRRADATHPGCLIATLHASRRAEAASRRRSRNGVELEVACHDWDCSSKVVGHAQAALIFPLRAALSPGSTAAARRTRRRERRGGAAACTAAGLRS